MVLLHVPEGHVAFTWAGLSRPSFQAKSDRQGKKYSMSAYCLPMSAVKIYRLFTAATGYQRFTSLKNSSALEVILFKYDSRDAREYN